MLRRGAATALIATAAALPFELRATLPLGPLRLSSLEVFLYATLGLWGASQLADPAARRRWLDVTRWPAVLRAAAALAVVLFLSAAAAPELRGPALKFALRSLSGVLLAFAAADLLREPGMPARLSAYLVFAMCFAAAAVRAEAATSSLIPWLRPFHDQTFQALGQTRGSGTFQFPNIAAMAIEATIPVALGLGLGGNPTSGGAGAVLFAVVILFPGVVATASRGALVGAAAATVSTVAIAIRRNGSRHLGKLAAVACGGLLLSGVASNRALWPRLRFWNEGHWYGARVAPAGGAADRLPPRMRAGGEATELVTVENRGAMTWSHRAPGLVALSYHWFDSDSGRVIVRDGKRTALPADLPPGQAVTLRAAVEAPDRPGRYVLAWDVVQEDVVWFSGRGPGLWTEPVLVGSVAPAARPPVLPVPPQSPPVSRRDLWRAAVAAFRAHPVLGVGPDNFRHVYGRYLGLHAPDERLHANSLYFETLADLGLAGVAAWLILAIALAAAAWRTSQNLLAVGISIALGTFLLHGTLDYFFEFTPTFAMFWLLAGALVALDPRTAELAA